MSSSSTTMTERLRALVHLNENGQAPVRNHLSVSGPQAAVERFLHSTRRAPDGGVEMRESTSLSLNPMHSPV